jgi:YVTN family beta-propeller protein
VGEKWGTDQSLHMGKNRGHGHCVCGDLVPRQLEVAGNAERPNPAHQRTLCRKNQEKQIYDDQISKQTGGFDFNLCPLDDALLFSSIGALCAHAEQNNLAKATTFGYVTNVDDNTVSVIDTVSNAVVATIPVGGFPDGVATTPDGTHAYVTNAFDSTVSVM